MTSNSSVTAGLTMLTSGVSQYLHPDYLQPLPTTLDAKKSPLALLAQTCSAIGKDSSPSKSIIPPLEKSSKDNNNDKTSSDKSGDSDSSSSSTSKRPSSHGHKDSGRESSSSSSSKPGFRTFPPKEIPPLVPIPSNGENNNGSKSSRLSSAEPKPATSPLMNSGASSLTVPPSLPRPVSANGAPRTSSRGSSSGKSEGVDHHHHHHHHNGSHHHHHQHGSNGSHHSQHPSSSSSSSHHHHRHRESPASSGSSSSSSSSTISSSSQHPRPSSSPSYSKSSSTQASSSVMHSPSSSSSASAMKQPPALVSHSSMLAGLPAHLAGYPNPLALMGQGLDASSYHSALAAHSGLTTCYTAAAAAAAAQSSALKAVAAGGSASALSPFVTYARVRTPSGATTLVPVCRDPYCTNCQLTVQNSHMSSNCTAPGCAQCAHEKSLTSLSALGSLPGAAAASSMLLPPLSSAGPALSAGSMSALSSLHSLYPHSALAAAAAAHQGLPPYVCSWVAGSDYCGKRFNTSEELLQHLRTHTSSLDVSSLAASYAGLGGIPSALAAYPHLSAAPLSPNSLRRAYPSSLSPVSSLLGASRYHPYKSPLSGVGAPPPQSLPPVGPYYSPYTLYGQRIGAAVVP